MDKALRKIFLVLTALLTLAIFSCKPATTTPPTPSTAAETALAPILDQYKLRGKVTLIQFGMVGCQRSDEGLVRMIKLHKNNSVADLAFLRIEQATNAEAVDAYYGEKGSAFPVHRDPAAALAVQVQATAIPTCVLVDKFGHPRYRGPFPEELLTDWVAVLAGEERDPGFGMPLFGATALDAPSLLAHTSLPAFPSKEIQPLTKHMGKAGLLVVFVDTSCPFSAQAMKDIPVVAPKLAGKKIPTVLINLDDPLENVTSRFSGHTFGTPVLYDVTTATKLQWNITSVPTLVYISPDMKVGYNGVAVWKELATAIETSRKLPAGSLNLTAQGTGFG